MTEYVKIDIAKRIGKSPRTVQLWTDLELVIPDIQPSGGKGVTRIYSDRNLIEFGMAKVLSERCNVTLSVIRYILEIIRKGESHGELIYDFYVNPDWGVWRELLYIGDIREGGIAQIRTILFDNERKLINFGKRYIQPFFDNDTLAITILMLGKIRNFALKELGLRLD